MGTLKESYKDVSIERLGAYVEITLARPEALNALSEDMLRSLKDIFDALVSEQGIRLVGIVGAGEKAFAAGADIRAMEKKDLLEIRSYIELGQGLMRSIESFPLPVVAFVNGFALGGGLELALACDCIFTSSNSRFGQPEVHLGLIPGFGGTQRLLLKVGAGQTKRLVFGGEMIGAQEAYHIGLVEKLVEKENFETEKKKFIESIIGQGPLAVRAAKSAIQETIRSILDAGLEREAKLFLKVFDTQDRKEGMQAFFEKRDPKFLGNL